jgi:hypothetical protein
MFVVFNCTKSSLVCQKSPKWMLSLCFKARHPFSMMKRHDPRCFHAKEGENEAAVISKVHHLAIQKKDDRQANTQNKERPTHSKFKFQIQIARNYTRGSERCEKDRDDVFTVFEILKPNDRFVGLKF